jgi:glycosyltransferase involved in cell wall biosynthesis
MKKLSVIVPAYNESERIGATLLAMNEYFGRQNYDYEIIVVVDGARDNTGEVVGKMLGRIKNLVLIDNKENHGKGWVVRQGMLKAQGEFRLFTDADNSTSIDQIAKFWPYTEQGFDIVIGSIEAAGAKVNEHAQWYRRFVGHAAKYLIRIVAGIWEIRDSQRGFKLFTQKAAQDVFSRGKIDRFGFDFEILAIAKKLNYKIKEVAVVWDNAGGSTVNLKSYIETFKDLARVRMNLWTNKYK